MLAFAVLAAYPQDHSSPAIEIKLPSGVNSEGVYIRCVLAGESFGDLVQARPGVSSYTIRGIAGEHEAAGIKAMIYVPGCAPQRLDRFVFKRERPAIAEFRSRPDISRAGPPDFAALAGTPDQPGEFQVWARDKVSGDVAALLVPVGHHKNERPETVIHVPDGPGFRAVRHQFRANA